VNTPKNYLILLLLLTTAGGATLAWRQYLELVQLRAANLKTDERADWQKRLWASEKRRRELEASLAAHKDRGSTATDGAPEAFAGPDEPGPGGRRGPNRGNLANNFMAMIDRPEIQKLMATQQRAALDSRYAALFRNLNLSPEQLEKFKNLLVEKQTAMTDALAAARAQGIDPRNDPQEFRKLVADAQAEVDASIQSTLGDPAYAQYQQYQQTLPQRTTVNQLQQSLSYTSTPLTGAQTEQMVSILAANSPPSANSAGASGRAAVASAFGVGFGGQLGSPITNDAITQSQTVLSPAQVQALQQLQAAQQAQAQLTQAMRDQFRNTPAPPTTTTTTTPPPTKQGPGGG
jgi:hypothetical protein